MKRGCRWYYFSVFYHLHLVDTIIPSLVCDIPKVEIIKWGNDKKGLKLKKLKVDKVKSACTKMESTLELQKNVKKLKDSWRFYLQDLFLIATENNKEKYSSIETRTVSKVYHVFFSHTYFVRPDFF